MDKVSEFPRGVLYAKKSDEKYSLTRLKPSSVLSGIIETFWFVSWDLSDKEPHVQQNIPDPCINIVFEADVAKVVGAVTKRYSVELFGKGRIFGIKFIPGGFYSLTGMEVSKFTDSDLSIKQFFGKETNELIKEINATSNIKQMVQLSENFFQSQILKLKRNANEVVSIVSLISNDLSILRVIDLSRKTGLSERNLQRLFKEQVGVSPKWVIRKYRIQEVLSRLEEGNYDWQQLVSQLDYFDQSHFIKDFKSLIGVTPVEYIKQLSTD